MIHVLLDTSVLRTDPRRKKADFRKLTKLAQSSFVKIHLPDVVCREFESQELAEFQKASVEVTRALLKLEQKVPPEAFVGLKGALERFQRNDWEIKDSVGQALPQWANGCGAEIHPVKDHHGREVVESYFKGRGGFSGAKERKDFPDAFIYQTILDVSLRLQTSHQGRLRVVVGDRNLASACGTLTNVTVFETVEGFLSDPECLTALESLEAKGDEKVLMDRLDSIRPQLFHMRGSLEGTARTLLLWLEGHEVSHTTFFSTDSSARIKQLEAITGLHLELNSVQMRGTDGFLLHFYAQVVAQVSYPIGLTYYYALNEGRAQWLSIKDINTLGDVAEASERVLLDVEGSFVQSLDFSRFADTSFSGLDGTPTIDEIEEAMRWGERTLENVSSVSVIGVQEEVPGAFSDTP